MFYDTLETPLGPLLIVADGRALRYILLPVHGRRARRDSGWERRTTPVIRRAKRELAGYFAGKRYELDLPYTLAGTVFQRAVWRELAKVPFGATISYGELARRVRRPQAARAVGSACGKNPLPILIPCHRVTGSDGTLVGFGGGLPMKAKLLRHEEEQVRP